MSVTPRVLVVDDKENMLKLFAKILADGYDLTACAEGGRALALVATEEYDVVVTDIRMPGASGFEVLRAVKARSPSTEVVMMTGYANVADAVQAMKGGAYDYLEKPFDPDAAALVVARAAERKRLRDEAATLRRELEGTFSFHNLIGKSRVMLEVYTQLEQAAGLDITVLLGGETGTGKELAARAIHYHSARRARRFVPVNCGALPPDLVESELFGHVKGAFTGAVGAKAGLFEEAEGGTIFLDEVGELPLPTQVKLNRALQEKEIRRVGGNDPVQVDVRVIAATHRDLRAEVASGRFREDLFYRLHVFPVRLPPLRDRSEDIPLLAAHFLEKHARAFRREVTGFEPDAMRVLTTYAWPGNVRELENAVERAVAVAKRREIGQDDLPRELLVSSGTVAPPGATLTMLPYRDAVDQARNRVSRE
jgi:two-component system response regulator AtoC